MAHAHHHDPHGAAGHGHYVIPIKVLAIIFGTLVFLTLLTVVTSRLDLGGFNVPLALAIAITKAMLVVGYFMALKYDNKVNTLVFSVGAVFVLVFLVFTLFDTAYRGDLGLETAEVTTPVVKPGVDDGAHGAAAPHGEAEAPDEAAPDEAAAAGAEAAPEEAVPAAADTTAAAADATGIVEVRITPVGNELKYAQTAFTVAAGAEVKLVFENTSTALPHNVVVVRGEDHVQRIGLAAIQAVATDYIPDDPAILAYTPLAQPGQTVEVTFTAPSAPGAYPYVCTFPGHFVTMRGLMQVE